MTLATNTSKINSFEIRIIAFHANLLFALHSPNVIASLSTFWISRLRFPHTDDQDRTSVELEIRSEVALYGFHDLLGCISKLHGCLLWLFTFWF